MGVKWQRAKRARKIANAKRRRQANLDKIELEQLRREGRMNRARSKAKREPWTFTKWLTLAIVGTWFVALAFCIFWWAKTELWHSEIMNTVNVVAVPTILSYAVKSGFEYKTRYDVHTENVNVEGSTSSTE